MRKFCIITHLTQKNQFLFFFFKTENINAEGPLEKIR